MPRRPMKLCLTGGCHVRSRGSRCKKHRVQVLRSAERRRGNAHQRGYGRKWRLVAGAWLRANPLCVRCGRMATVCDHIIPHRRNAELFWDVTNRQSLCKRCHDRKTGAGQ